MTRTSRAIGTAGESRVLIVAHDEESARPLQQALQAVGIRNIEILNDARRALPSFRQLAPDIVVLESALEQMDPLSLMKQIHARVPEDQFLPFIVLSPGPEAPLKRTALEEGLPAFFEDTHSPDDIALLVSELTSIRRQGFDLLSAARVRTARADATEVEVARHLARFAEFKDHPYSGHVHRVGHLSGLIGLLLGLATEDVETIRLAAPLHDVGKIGIPDSILDKEEPLTLEEMDVVKTHTTLGATILAGSSTKLFQMAEEIALYHHENWDGTGYTPGLEGESIPLIGRIVRVVDAFECHHQRSTFRRTMAPRQRH